MEHSIATAAGIVATGQFVRATACRRLQARHGTCDRGVCKFARGLGKTTNGFAGNQLVTCLVASSASHLPSDGSSLDVSKGNFSKEDLQRRRPSTRKWAGGIRAGGWGGGGRRRGGAGMRGVGPGVIGGSVAAEPNVALGFAIGVEAMEGL